MKLKHFLLAVSLTFATAAPTFAQKDNDYSQEKDFTLHRYSPEWVNAPSLVNTIESLYGRVLEFEDRSVENLTLLDNSIVIYETTSRLSRILDAIKTLDTSAEGEWEDEEDHASRIDPSYMVIRSFHPQHVDVAEFYALASELYEREILVGDDWHSNLRFAQNRGLTIYEETERVDELLQRLNILDESQEMEVQNPLVVIEYQPRFVSPNGLMEGMQSFLAPVFESNYGARTSVQNISLMRERGMIVIRDYPERAEQILTILERIDQPIPQTMMICQVIRGSNREPVDGDQLASEEVAQQLGQILPHKYYTVSGAGMLRANVMAGAKLELIMDIADNPTKQYNLQMRVGSYDSKKGSLNLEGCELSTESIHDDNRRPLFQTSTTIYNGEYAVIGVTGAEPLFLVVQLVPVKSH